MSADPEARYFGNNAPLKSINNAFGHLVASLERVVSEAPPEHRFKWHLGIYDGPTSLAFLFHRLSKIYPELLIKDVSLHEWSLKYLASARLNEPIEKRGKNMDPVHPKDCGILNETVSNLAVRAAAISDIEAAKELCGFAASAVAPNEGELGWHEWAYGKAGYLYLLRLAETGVPETDDDTRNLIHEAAGKVIQKILAAPKPWLYRNEEEYIGPGHGVIGIITQVVLTSPKSAPELEADLKRLLSYQLKNGNWPPSTNIPETDVLVQFCHGSPGFNISLRSLRPYFPNLQSAIDAAISKGTECAWERGLLRKDPNLCHGITGNALAFDDREKFEHFLSFATQESLTSGFESGQFKQSDMPYTTLAGEGGRAWAWAVADKGLEKRMIGYNDL
jgi:hypothetical protein